MPVNDDGRTVAAMDVLAPGIGAIIAYVTTLPTCATRSPSRERPATHGIDAYYLALAILHEWPRQLPSRAGP
jgi:hypothetical protein